jgi:hypothetical protein
LDPREALYDISYINAVMYSRAVPLMGDETEDDTPEFDESLDANNPDNFDKFSNFEDEEIVVKA